MTEPERHIETTIIHAGEPTPRIMGAVSLPIFQSSTFEYGGQDSYHDLKYIRLNNTPNHIALHQKLAALESGNCNRQRYGGNYDDTANHSKIRRSLFGPRMLVWRHPRLFN